MANNSAPRIAPREGLIDEVAAALGDALIEAKDAVGEVSLTVRRESDRRGLPDPCATASNISS